MRHRPKRSNFRAGYTLVEMLVASASSAILLAGIMGSFIIASRAFDESDGEIAKSVAAGNIGDHIMNEMRYATRFYERTPYAVRFSVPDRNGDGSEEQFRFAWSGVAGEPLTKEVNGSAPAVLLANVENLNFTYMTRIITGAGQPVVFDSQVVFEEFTEANSVNDELEITISTPGGSVAGDLLIAAVALKGSQPADLAPRAAGWNLVYVSGPNKVTYGVWWKLVDAAEPPTHTFSWSIAAKAYAWMMRFTGHHPTTPLNASAFSSGTSASPSSPAVTTTVDNALILRLGGFERNSFTLDQPGLPGHIAITMDGNSAASGGAGYLEPVSAGSSGTSSFSLSSQKAYVTVTLAIAPATE